MPFCYAWMKASRGPATGEPRLLCILCDLVMRARCAHQWAHVSSDRELLSSRLQNWHLSVMATWVLVGICQPSSHWCLQGSQAVALWQAWGLMEQRAGNADQARILFQQGLESLPYNRFLLLACGQLEKEQGNIAEARRLLRFGVKNNPLDPALIQVSCAGILSTCKLHLRVCHISSCLRSFGKHACSRQSSLHAKQNTSCCHASYRRLLLPAEAACLVSATSARLLLPVRPFAAAMDTSQAVGFSTLPAELNSTQSLLRC